MWNAPKLGLGFALLLCGTGSLVACRKNWFRSDTQDPRPTPTATAGARGTKTCVEGHKALRVVFLIDNSESNNCLPGRIQPQAPFCGTDPVRANEAFPQGFTTRQRSVRDAVVELVERDHQLRTRDSQFAGSALALVTFPLNASPAGVESALVLGGAGSVLPAALSNTLDLVPDEGLKQGLWSLLGTTHSPQGATPYVAALQTAETLLATPDNRDGLLVFVTDGFPTDEQPSRVRALRNRMGHVPLLFFSLRPPESGNAGNSVVVDSAKQALKKDWDEKKWGRREGASDGFADFESYWQALAALPGSIATRIRQVNNPDALPKALFEEMSTFQKCENPPTR